MNMRTVKFEMTPEQAQYIFDKLAKCPFVEVMALIPLMQDQFSKQENAYHENAARPAADLDVPLAPQ